jgi:hypothetical protein
MKYLWMTALLALIANEAAAQGPAFRPGPSGNSYMPTDSPAVSPYLNLLRSGSSTAVNYYGLVRPAIDTQASINNLQQQVGGLSAPGSGMGSSGELPALVTGSSVRFMSTGNYFLSGIQPGNLSGRSTGGMRSSSSSFNVNMPQNLTGQSIRYNPTGGSQR